ncbi:hypothetical protein LC55x_4622 [Lysobacter capsici]|nr:hypothetical protein LC55x_4622 [Lysobacter capsici]
MRRRGSGAHDAGTRGERTAEEKRNSLARTREKQQREKLESAFNDSWGRAIATPPAKSFAAIHASHCENKRATGRCESADGWDGPRRHAARAIAAWSRRVRHPPPINQSTQQNPPALPAPRPHAPAHAATRTPLHHGCGP